ncbi:MAG TPA: hypothetical protein VL689_13945 [Paraburkholderia sp.]|jgi:hypothetical protein|nr:hypothetical protein [Paraburkholderia sp.]
MSTVDDREHVDHREAIRRKAFELADSGMLDDWAAIRRTLHACFDIESVEQVLGSPFFRLDLDRRCWAGRARRTQFRRVPAWTDERDDVADRAGHPSPRASSPKARARCDGEHAASAGRRSPVLAADIAALLADGGERTVAQLAAQFGASTRDVQRTLQTMLAADEVHVSGRVQVALGGRAARVFAGGPPPDGGRAVMEATSSWPKADPVLLRAMDALARHE